MAKANDSVIKYITNSITNYQLQVTHDVEKQKATKPATKGNQFQALYMYQAETLPGLLKKLGKEERGSMNDPILWQVTCIIRIALSCVYYVMNPFHPIIL